MVGLHSGGPVGERGRHERAGDVAGTRLWRPAVVRANDHGRCRRANGQVIAFSSSATQLVAGDTNGAVDVFVHDRSSGTTERVSVASTGQQGVAPSAPTMAVTAVRCRPTVAMSHVQQRTGRAGPRRWARRRCVRTRPGDRHDGPCQRRPGWCGGGLLRAVLPSMSPSGRYVAFQARGPSGVDKGMVFDRSGGTTRVLADHRPPTMVSDARVAYSTDRQLGARRHRHRLRSLPGARVERRAGADRGSGLTLRLRHVGRRQDDRA